MSAADYHWRANDQPSGETPALSPSPAPVVAPAPARKPKWIPTSLSGKGVRCDVVERWDGRHVDEWGQVWGGQPGVE